MLQFALFIFVMASAVDIGNIYLKASLKSMSEENDE